ncbi:UDP-glucose 4-epimerase GalE [Agrobacterium tumefaciens]|uniref:UDP-glucose 4-epimerase n=1 Tax=Agrobacterium tumefaciens TaxID=358 RepID=A0A2L2L8D4_AGRTU|nr:UDP-glucose 4-epimerase GalE [Agrobacterium tumefaciens]AVH40581.1 UDP-glucose 4-epimerase [Agrobacterium tumefaciens]NSY94556.1 UDP-glucose 4-epimerase GalE [Agrobacterium tumefaciens]NSZ02616.1 UDP-glucose 4-epimerase GalE [Agrobacterium tumefaciens]NSZ40818.1 UDP-glucose 4-epimerase GalE [Agrobacterium tumefaciens]NTB01045.1 UDP-glucose 4-epimerase GalE [Agrobacterium tumefaciens]
MAVLVTGGAGYIGSHMVWALLDAGEEVVVVDRLSTGSRWAVAPAARFYLGDAADRALLDQIFEENQIETIFHFAGSVSVPESISQPLEYYENNTGTTRALVAAAVAHGIRNFIFSSTAAVYGNQPFDGPVPETAILSPENPYGLSKLASEIMLRDVVQAHDFNYVALRYFNVAGADPQGRAGPSPTGVANLIKVACEAATGRRDQVEVYGTDYPTADGTGVRDYIHVSDLIDAHMLAMAHLRAGGGTRTLNCGYGVGYSVLDVLQAVQRESERDFPIIHCPRRAGDIATMVADSSRIQSELGWRPRFDDLATIVRTALQWEAKRQAQQSDRIPPVRRKLAAIG